MGRRHRGALIIIEGFGSEYTGENSPRWAGALITTRRHNIEIRVAIGVGGNLIIFTQSTYGDGAGNTAWSAYLGNLAFIP